jgi:hypothetical protein
MQLATCNGDRTTPQQTTDNYGTETVATENGQRATMQQTTDSRCLQQQAARRLLHRANGVGGAAPPPPSMSEKERNSGFIRALRFWVGEAPLRPERRARMTGATRALHLPADQR